MKYVQLRIGWAHVVVENDRKKKWNLFYTWETFIHWKFVYLENLI